MISDKEVKEAVNVVLEYGAIKSIQAGTKEEPLLKSFQILLDIAQSYLSAEMPEEKPESVMVYHTGGIGHPMADIYAEGWNACLRLCRLASVKDKMRVEELEKENKRLADRDGTAKIYLCYDDGVNPIARKEWKIVDFGCADNVYIVEAKSALGQGEGK